MEILHSSFFYVLSANTPLIQVVNYLIRCKCPHDENGPYNLSTLRPSFGQLLSTYLLFDCDILCIVIGEKDEGLNFI